MHKNSLRCTRHLALRLSAMMPLCLKPWLLLLLLPPPRTRTKTALPIWRRRSSDRIFLVCGGGE
jgi:hypothetical protein